MRFYKTLYEIKLRFKVVFNLIPNVFIDRKVIFTHMPKAAGISISKAIYGREIGHIPLWVYKKILGREFKNYYTFTFVRHPLSRLESAYYFLKSGGITSKDDRFSKKILVNYRTFDSFVIDYLNEDTIWSYIHFFPQTYFLNADSSLDNKFVGKVESLNQDIDILMQRLGFDVHVKMLNKTVKKKTDQKKYSQDVVSKVEELYKDDYSYFGYITEQKN